MIGSPSCAILEERRILRTITFLVRLAKLDVSTTSAVQDTVSTYLLHGSMHRVIRRLSS